jgi:hypothetical protein
LGKGLQDHSAKNLRFHHRWRPREAPKPFRLPTGERQFILPSTQPASAAPASAAFLPGRSFSAWAWLSSARASQAPATRPTARQIDASQTTSIYAAVLTRRDLRDWTGAKQWRSTGSRSNRMFHSHFCGAQSVPGGLPLVSACAQRSRTPAPRQPLDRRKLPLRIAGFKEPV